MKTYGLNPVNNYGLPALLWDSMMALIIDPDMCQFVEQGIRGGIINIIHRYATSNYPSMESYNPNDVEYTEKLYPLAPEVKDKMMSPFQGEHFPSIRGSIKRLVANMHDKHMVSIIEMYSCTMTSGCVLKRYNE